MRNRKKYPRHWKKLATACKDRANWKCEECYVPHGTIRTSRHTGRSYKVRLQAAHRNHDPENPYPELVCVCEYCHWHFFSQRNKRPGWYIEKLKHRQRLAAKGYLVEEHERWKSAGKTGIASLSAVRSK
jgi:hypothetical protein